MQDYSNCSVCVRVCVWVRACGRVCGRVCVCVCVCSDIPDPTQSSQSHNKAFTGACLIFSLTL